MDRFFIGCAVSIFGIGVAIAKWLTGGAIVFSQTLPAETQQLDLFPLVKTILDYGLSGGILVGAYFLGRYLIDRIGDKIENKIESTEKEIQTNLNEIKSTINQWK